jgi:capping protein alpha
MMSHSRHTIVVQVQLETKHNASITLPASVTASSPGVSSKKILALIADQEGAYQESLGDTYHEMGEKTFKGLRRALPLTRQKLDWDKVRPSLLNLMA